ncbi:MAG: SGNH/GDSL hydrolase family protein [Planctomycetes bacterium]|nr:SGNH/GDSL hydrolase family protein [Planctomycetota bacterium]
MWRRLALVLGALLFCAALLEGGLRGAALLTTLRSRAAARDVRTILCLGDSNTYGAYMKEEETYPARLRARLRVADPTVEVVNLGVPGRTSREVREEVASSLSRYTPVAVLVLVGVNDTWREAGPSGGAIGRLLSSSRLVRAARILLARKGPPRGISDPTGGGPAFRLEGRAGADVLVESRAGPPPESSELDERLRANLAAIARAAREAGATPVFLTYGPEEGGFDSVNAVIREFAATSGEALVDVAPLARELARRGWYTEFYYQDFHPRAPGYEAIARLVFGELVRRGLFRGEPLADPLEGLEPAHAVPQEAIGRDRSNPSIRLLGTLADPGSLSLEIEDAPGLRFRVLLSFEDPPPWARALRAESFRDDPVFNQSFGLPELGGTFDAQGRARIALARLAREGGASLRGRRLQVAYFVQAYEGDPWVRGLSGTRAFELR